MTSMMKFNLSTILIPYKSIAYSTLKEEQRECVEFANEMRMLSMQKNFPYVWFHIGNEFIPTERKNFSFDLKQKHMGKVTGIADYCFVSAKDNFFVEFKSAKGKQTESQKTFQVWCAMNKVDYFLCRSAREGIDLIHNRLKNINQS